MLCIENVNKSTQILKGKYCYLQLWEHSKGEGEQKIFFYMLSTKTKYKNSARIHWNFAKFSVELLKEMEHKTFCDACEMLH